MAAAGYILSVPSARRPVLLDTDRSGPGLSKFTPAEPVPRFEHAWRSPLVVFASFQDGHITHIANGRRGRSAGTDLMRLNLEELVSLKAPISFESILAEMPAHLRQHLQRAFESGGVIREKTLVALVDVISRLDDSAKERLTRFSTTRQERIRALSPKALENLAVQKETVAAALDIARLSPARLLAWTPKEGQRSFLEGLPQAYVREDAMVSSDLTKVPGFSAIQEGATQYAACTFEAEQNSDIKLTVVMANKLPLEEQTGADLIYYNEKYRSFVMVQYKAMEKGKEVSEFRWKNGDQLALEIERMDAILAELAKVPPDVDPDGYRFTHNPFFLKFCSRMNFDPDDKGLFPGMYIPLDLWKQLAASGRLKGLKGGNLLTFENVGRRLSNTDFIAMVGKAWIGTTIGQSSNLADVIREVMATGKTVTFAIKHLPPPRPRHGGTVTDENPLAGMAYFDDQIGEEEPPEEEPPELA